MTIHRNHRIVWPMVRNHRKPSKAMVKKIKNHWKTIDCNGQTPKKHSMVMVSWKLLKIYNGLFKTIEIYNYCKNKCWETFSLLYCVIFTLWNDVRSQYIWSISSGLWWYAKNLCFVVNWFYALFRCNGTSKPLLISKPLLTIALKILKTIEKPLTPNLKKHSVVMVQ